MENIKKSVISNLTYCRLQADVYAVEADIADNQPLAAGEEKGIVKKFLNAITTEVQNEIRKKNVQELTVDRQAAIYALSAFEGRHAQKQLALAQDREKFKEYIQKKLFKKDVDGLGKMQFALAFLLDNGTEYQRPEQSLQAVSEILFDDPTYMQSLYVAFCENFYKIQDKRLTAAETGSAIEEGLASLLNVAQLVFGAMRMEALIVSVKNKKRMHELLQDLSQNELHTLLAVRLTLLQEAKKTMAEEKLKELVDDYLKYVSNLRSDAEYQWLVERLDVPSCQEKIKTCDLCIARLSRILGI